MKRLDNLIYIGFALIIWGSFANFAQNDYGYVMIMWSQFVIGLILLLEGMITLSRGTGKGRATTFRVFVEHFLLGCFFLAGFLKYMHWPGAGPLYGLSSLLALIYIPLAFIRLFSDLKRGRALALMIFLVYFSASLALLAYVFKVMHWPGGMMLGSWCVGLCLVIVAIGLLKRKFVYQGEAISLFTRIRRLSGRPGLVFGFFNAWILYITLIVLGFAPDFYTYAMMRPPAIEQLRQKGQDDRADQYQENFNTFFEHRWEEENK